MLQDSVRKSLVTATAASSCIACALMGLGANMPVALAPGMGLNAYFSAVVGYRGSGTVRPSIHPLAVLDMSAPLPHCIVTSQGGAHRKPSQLHQVCRCTYNSLDSQLMHLLQAL